MGIYSLLITYYSLLITHYSKHFYFLTPTPFFVHPLLTSSRSLLLSFPISIVQIQFLALSTAFDQIAKLASAWSLPWSGSKRRSI